MNRYLITGALLTLGVVLLAVITTLLYLPATQPLKPTDAVPTLSPIIPDTETTPTSTRIVIGSSVEGRSITVHTFGTGDTDLLLVGGIHGGYEGNTVALAERMISELHTAAGFSRIPDTVTVHIIPNLNPDGYALADTAGDFDRRMNANGVDLNRNFDCRWEPESTWRSSRVSGGTAPFSEPEAVALYEYVTRTTPDAVVVWHSKANAVYTSECDNGVVEGGEALMNTYATAGNYRAAGLWTAYPVTGAVEDWLASINIPAITVELETRDNMEWERNWAAVQAVMRMPNQ